MPDATTPGRRPRGRGARRWLGRGRAGPVAGFVESMAPPDGDFDLIPRGRTEPFNTPEYDVLPRGRFDIIRHDYFSPVPDLALLPADVWTRRSELVGGGFDLEAAACLIEQQLAPYIAELEVPHERVEQPGVFYLNNLNYERVDAELLYAVVRHFKPRRIVELGSGFSTLLIGQACERNRAEGHSCSFVAYDPHPRPAVLGENPRGLDRLEPTGATDVGLETFAQLGPGDLLFVDTTHTVKLGGDVNFVVLEVLPRLAPGVLVHFHDIFLPYEYPRVWAEERGYYWAEQYLLQAFLAFNHDFHVLIPAQALARELPERIARVIPTFWPGVSPGAFWLVRARRPESRPAGGDEDNREHPRAARAHSRVGAPEALAGAWVEPDHARLTREIAEEHARSAALRAELAEARAALAIGAANDERSRAEANRLAGELHALETSYAVLIGSRRWRVMGPPARAIAAARRLARR